MDMKSMAKSKRSHTQHNQPRKPSTHPPKPTSSSKNPSISSKVTKDKPKFVHQKPSLPSNWDRYDENNGEEGDFLGEIPVESMSKEAGKKAVYEEVKPKSKGADFGYLIAQAKESKHTFLNSPSFGDSIDDFYQGLAPMLEVRSEGGVPSWDRDDDFLLESEATTSDEAPSFSLDLKALAEDLSKLDLAERLFIEAELLPPELRAVDDNDLMPEKRLQTFETFEELYSIYLADEKAAEAEDASKGGIASSLSDPSNSMAKDTPRPTQVSEQDTGLKLHDFGRDVSQQGTSKSNLTANSMSRQTLSLNSEDVSRPAQKLTSSLDDELDDLLHSSSSTEVKGGSADSAAQKVTGSLDDELADLLHASSFVEVKGGSTDLAAQKVTSSLDDELDDLLGASNSIEVKGGLIDYGATLGVPLRNFQEDSSRPASSVVRGSLDDELDNLLEETYKPTTVKIDATVFLSPTFSSSIDPPLKPEVMDDFDSWMDSL